VRKILLATFVSSLLVVLPAAMAGATETLAGTSITTVTDTATLDTAVTTTSATDTTVAGAAIKCPNPGGHTPPPCNGHPGMGPKCPNPGGHTPPPCGEDFPPGGGGGNGNGPPCPNPGGHTPPPCDENGGGGEPPPTVGECEGALIDLEIPGLIRICIFLPPPE
jgi:hypothetical protein